MKLLLLIGSFLYSVVLFSQSDSSWYSANRLSIRGQFAGHQGLASAGVLTNLGKDRIQLGLMYGYAPGKIHTPDFHGITLRSTWALPYYSVNKEKTLSATAFASVSGMLEVGDISFLFLPDEFPDRYYFPQALHAIFGAGLKLKESTGVPWALTIETVTLDTQLWYLLSQRQVDFEDVWSLSLGLELKPFLGKGK